MKNGIRISLNMQATYIGDNQYDQWHFLKLLVNVC